MEKSGMRKGGFPCDAEATLLKNGKNFLLVIISQKEEVMQIFHDESKDVFCVQYRERGFSSWPMDGTELSL